MSSDGTRSIGELADLRRGSTYKSVLLNQEGPVLLGLSSIAPNGGFRRGSLKTYGGDSPVDITLGPGDLYVSLKDVTQSGDLLGAVARVPPDVAAGRLTQDTVKLTLRDGTLEDADYLYWLLRSPQYREYCRIHAIGVTTLALPREDFLAYPVPPQTPLRAAIVQALRVLDDKIQHNRLLARRLDDLCRLTYRAMACASKGEGWDAEPIGNCVSVVGGSTPSTKEPKYWGGEIPFATPKDLAGLEVPILIETERTITEDGVRQISSGVLPQGTVLLSSRAPIGYLAIAQTSVAVNQGFVAMICDGALPNHYVLRWAQASLEEIVSQANGSTFLEISKRDFRPILVPLPTPEALERFMATATPAHELMSSLLIEVRALTEARNALLPKLVEGRIRVRERYEPDDVLGTLVDQITTS